MRISTLRPFVLTILLFAFSSFAVFAQGKKELTLEAIFERGEFGARRLGSLDAYGDGEHYTILDRRAGIRKHSYEAGEFVGDVLRFAELPDSVPSVVGYTLSPDNRYVLLETQSEPLYRHSRLCNYWVCDLSNPAAAFRLSAEGKQRLAHFSSDSHRIAYVRGNNIYVLDLSTRREVAVTRDGRLNFVINGVPDWVYEEEFSLLSAMSWSPCGRYLAYYRFDESEVLEFTMPIYGGGLYTDQYAYKYPKAGEQNSEVQIYVFDVETGKSVKVNVGEERDQYIPRIMWSPSGELAVLRLNRLQNHLEVLFVDASSGASRVVFEEREEQYVEEPSDWYLTFLSDGKRFIVPSERDGTRQLYLYDLVSRRLEQLTRGDEIVRVYGYSEKDNLLFYKGYDGSPLRTAIFSLKLDAKREKRKISERLGSNDAWFDPLFTYFLITHNSVREVPSVTLFSREMKSVRVVEDNSRLQRALAQYTLPEKRFFTFKTPDGVELNGYMVQPLNFDSTHKYPVMMYQYSGPNSQQVVDKFGVNWDSYLATKGCLVVCVDGRGTGGRGEAFRKCTYGKLGALEVEDQLAAARYIASQPYADGARIGIWGWSYGGYMSSLCLLRGAELYRMAIAVAPVTNWRYYDTVYTERFMGLPQDNASGYDDNSPMHFANNLKGSLLLIHGSADDNVHYQNTAQFAQRLISAGKPFEMMVYPDRNHGIYGGGATMHLYNHMFSFIERTLFQ